MKSMTRLLLCALLVLVPGAAAHSQDLGSVLKIVEQNNTALKALRAGKDAEKAEARTGLAPDEPELGLAYLWGTPREQGNRVDISLTQSFDFPTAYLYRSRIAAGKATVAEYEYSAGRSEILLQAEKTYIEIAFKKAALVNLERRLRSAETIMDVWQKKFDSGSATSLELDKAKLNLYSATKDYEIVLAEKESCEAELKHLAGGTDCTVEDDGCASVLLPEDFDTWFSQACSVNPALKALEAEVCNSANGVRLAMAESLPKFSVGYESERIAGTTLQGIGGGISIPLWSRKGTVKAARARSEALKASYEEELDHFSSSLRRLYDEARSLSRTASDYRSRVSSLSSPELLDKALESGEISLSEYVLEQTIWFDALSDALTTEMDCRLLVAELNRCFR